MVASIKMPQVLSINSGTPWNTAVIRARVANREHIIWIRFLYEVYPQGTHFPPSLVFRPCGKFALRIRLACHDEHQHHIRDASCIRY